MNADRAAFGSLSCLPPELWSHLSEEEIIALDSAEGAEFVAWADELEERLNRLARQAMQRARARIALARARILAGVTGRVYRALAMAIARPVEAIVARGAASGARRGDDPDAARAVLLAGVL